MTDLINGGVVTREAGSAEQAAPGPPHTPPPGAPAGHARGLPLPRRGEGGPHQVAAPGAPGAPGWPIDPPATTLWYHPHPDRQTADQVYRGIAGLIIIDDADTRALPLP